MSAYGDTRESAAFAQRCRIIMYLETSKANANHHRRTILGLRIVPVLFYEQGMKYSCNNRS